MYSFRDYDLPLNRELQSSLQSIKGVGWRKALLVTAKYGFGYPFFISNINFYQFNLLSFMLTYLVRSEAKAERFITSNIRVLIEMQCYRGLRHRDFLPVRGQRTRTNAGVRKRQRYRLSH